MTRFEKDTYRYALKAAIADYEGFGEQRRKLEEDMDEVDDARAKLRRTITALAILCGESPYFDPLGITDSCMEVMANETQEVSTTDVLKRLDEMGFDLSSQKNPAASVHTVLSRLAEKGKINKVEDANTITWLGPKFSPPDEHFGADVSQQVEISEEDIPF